LAVEKAPPVAMRSTPRFVNGPPGNATARQLLPVTRSESCSLSVATGVNRTR